MSRVVVAHLRREYREQRMALSAILILLAIAATVGGWAVARGELHTDALRTGLWISAHLAFLALVAGDLLSGDRARGTREFLARTPRGLAASFRGKLAFLLLAAPLAPLLALPLGTLAVLPSHPELASTSAPWTDVFTIWAAGVVTVWVFAGGAWVRRGVLALPLALLFLSPFVALIAWTHRPVYHVSGPSLRLPWVDDPRIVFGALLVLGFAFAALAWRRRTRGAWATLVLGIVGMATPGALHVWNQSTPAGKELQLFGVALDAPRGRVLAWATDEQQTHWEVAVDLRTGVLTQLSDTDVAAHSQSINGPTAEFELPDGGRAWLRRDGLRIGTPGHEDTEFAWPASWPIQLGWGVQVEAERGTRPMDTRYGTIDLLRRRHVREPTWVSGACVVLVDRWLVAERLQPNTTLLGRWRSRDPATGEETPAPAMCDGDRVLGALPDGQLVVLETGVRRASDTVLVDLTAERRTPLRLPGRENEALRLGPALGFGATTVCGRAWFQAADHSLVSLAIGEPLRVDGYWADIIAALDGRTLLTTEFGHRQLRELDAASGRTRVLYPR